MTRTFNKYTTIEIMEFENERTTNSTTLFEGNIEDFEVGINQVFEGFESGDTFSWKDEKVKVLSSDLTKNPEGIITHAIYKVTPHPMT